MKKVYLAGPIAGLTYDEGVSWRNWVAHAMPAGISCFSPLRGKEYLRPLGILEQGFEKAPLSTDRAIMARDYYDCQSADLIFAYLSGAERISIGTVMEIAWAYAYPKPLVLVIEAEGNSHDHPMIREAADFRCSTLAEGVLITRSILFP